MDDVVKLQESEQMCPAVLLFSISYTPCCSNCEDRRPPSKMYSYIQQGRFCQGAPFVSPDETLHYLWSAYVPVCVCVCACVCMCVCVCVCVCAVAVLGALAPAEI